MKCKHNWSLLVKPEWYCGQREKEFYCTKCLEFKKIIEKNLLKVKNITNIGETISIYAKIPRYSTPKTKLEIK